MKAKEIEFDLDFIGEQTPLTIEEEKDLYDYFKQKNAILKLSDKRKSIKKNRNVTK